QEAVAEDIWELVTERLGLRNSDDPSQPEPLEKLLVAKQLPTAVEPPPAATKGAPLATAAMEPYLVKTATGYTITPAGEAYLGEFLTDPTGNVYAFTHALDTTTVAAAMARLSRRGDDMRVTLLDEFAKTAGKDEQLLRRVITAYGDDSVQQLSGIHFV